MSIAYPIGNMFQRQCFQSLGLTVIEKKTARTLSNKQLVRKLIVYSFLKE